MAMNSIDMVTMLPRTVEAAELQGKEQSQLQNAAQHPGVQFQQKTEHDARQTVETQESETDYEKREGGNGKKERQMRKKKRERDKKEAPVAPRSDSSFDIMI